MNLADLIGPMLGADFLYAEGEIEETNTSRPVAVVHRFWAHRQRWRVERNDGVVFIDGSDGSATLIGGRVQEVAPVRRMAGFHIAERLLRPRHAPIWGRPGEDWRLTDDLETSAEGLVRLTLQGTGGHHAERGSILVDPDLGRLHHVSTPGFAWTLLRVEEESGADVEGLFELPLTGAG